MAWWICTMKYEFAKKSIIESQCQFMSKVCYDLMWLRRYVPSYLAMFFSSIRPVNSQDFFQGLSFKGHST